MTNPMPTTGTGDDFLVFEPFVRTKFPVLICLFGFSGCGKTKSAIKIAQGLGGKTMFMDTETGRGRVYAEDAKGFGYTELTPPFTPERYMAAIKQVERAGFDNLVIDSVSHEWDGLGGMLEIAEGNVTKTGKKIEGRAKWSVKSRHKAFMNTMMAGRMNIIICLRAKDRFVERFIENKKESMIDGFLPLQERNFKYDMMVQLPMPEGGKGRYLMDETLGFKCPEMLLSAFQSGNQITEEVGKKISEWIATGEAVDELLRQAREKAMVEAEQGVEHFREYWKTLPRDVQAKLKPYSANFESIAKTADLEKEEDETGVAPTNVNSAGVDLGFLMPKHSTVINDPGMTHTIVDPGHSQKLPPQTLGDLLDNFPQPQPRDPAHADWWTVIEQLETQVRLCKSRHDVEVVFDENIRQIGKIYMAPEPIIAHWQSVMTFVNERFGLKAA